jgi:NAD(P)-dependent dehydrogenase (short-subunit alcohol dehydrogenase family)
VLGIDMTGRTAVVTGAGQGVGKAISMMFAQAGATVWVNDFVAAHAEAACEEIRAAGGSAHPAVFDVTDLDAVTSSPAFANCDILINNAGNAGPGGWPGMVPFVDTDPAQWGKFMNVNLFGVMNCSKAALPSMIAGKWGRIVTIISDAARAGEPYMAAYAAAKAGAAGFCRSLAIEVGRHNITVNCVALGSIAGTGLSAGRNPGDRPPVPKRYIVRRDGRPEDVAPMVTFLASDGAEWITGQTYPVNGGYSLAL